MTIAEDLQTIINQKEAIRQAIISKGVDVPEEARIDTYHEYIDQINTASEGDGTDWGTLYTTAYPDGIVLTEADYTALSSGTSSTGNYILSVGTIKKSTITGYSFGKYCTLAAGYFLYSCSNLETVTHTAVLKTVGARFLASNPKLNSPIKLPDIEEIGGQFLDGCAAFNSPVILGDKLKKIGQDFMNSCSAFTQTLKVPASVEEIGAGFMQGCGAFTGLLIVETSTLPLKNSTSRYTALTISISSFPMYAEGIKITGAGAQAWKTGMPDSDKSPYRKLLLVET